MKTFPATPTTYDGGNTYLFELNGVPFRAAWNQGTLMVTHRHKRLELPFHVTKLKYSFELFYQLNSNNQLELVRKESYPKLTHFFDSEVDGWANTITDYILSYEGSIIIHRKQETAKWAIQSKIRLLENHISGCHEQIKSLNKQLDYLNNNQ